MRYVYKITIIFFSIIIICVFTFNHIFVTIKKISFLCMCVVFQLNGSDEYIFLTNIKLAINPTDPHNTKNPIANIVV